MARRAPIVTKAGLFPFYLFISNIYANFFGPAPGRHSRPRWKAFFRFEKLSLHPAAQCAVQTMQASKERTTCWIAGALSPAETTSTPTSVASAPSLW
jgi:hypothetical protein